MTLSFSDYFALLVFLNCFILSLSSLQNCSNREHLGGALVLSSSCFCGSLGSNLWKEQLWSIISASFLHPVISTLHCALSHKKVK